MGIELVLNDLSFEPFATDRAAARQRVVGFQRTASAAIRMRANRYVRCPEHIQKKFLAEGYSVGDLFSDPEVDKELIRLLKSWFTKSPYWQGDMELEQKVRSRMFEFAGRDNAVGLGVASLLNGLGVSFASEEIWSRTNIELRVLTELFDGDEALTNDEVVSVYHISHPDHLEIHRQWIDERLLITPNDGKEILDRRSEWCSSLDFCDKAKSQLHELPREMLSSVTEHLLSLQRYCENWSEGAFDKSQFPPSRISPETPVTLQRYGAERTFICPDGVERTFSWHLKLNPSTWRIYFEPVPATNRMIIGYIGPHLRTARFNN